jgi:hypothetical protein
MAITSTQFIVMRAKAGIHRHGPPLSRYGIHTSHRGLPLFLVTPAIDAPLRVRDIAFRFPPPLAGEG